VIVHQQRYRLSDCKENVEIQFSVSGITFIISSSKDKNFRHCMQIFDKNKKRVKIPKGDQICIYSSWIQIDSGKFTTKCHYLFFFCCKFHHFHVFQIYNWWYVVILDMQITPHLWPRKMFTHHVRRNPPHYF
jgi:hypothetical protein